jgi:hypothetical protein
VVLRLAALFSLVPALASLSFFIAGGIKIAYDLVVYVAFRKLPAPEERPRVDP